MCQGQTYCSLSRKYHSEPFYYHLSLCTEVVQKVYRSRPPTCPDVFMHRPTPMATLVASYSQRAKCVTTFVDAMSSLLSGEAFDLWASHRGWGRGKLAGQQTGCSSPTEIKYPVIDPETRPSTYATETV